MGVLVVRCPKTRFSIGIQIERADFEHLYEDVIAAARCPYGKIEHRWHYRGADISTQSRQRTGSNINKCATSAVSASIDRCLSKAARTDDGGGQMKLF
jgi:hypothetical protein